MGGLSKRTMDYSNLAASCIRDPSEYEKLHSLSGADFSNLGSSILHCGHARGSHKVVSPYDPKCEHLFFYSFSGEVLVNPGLENSGDIRLAQDSIAFLRLNVPQLVSLRALAMFETLKLLDGRGVGGRYHARTLRKASAVYFGCKDRRPPMGGTRQSRRRINFAILWVLKNTRF